MAVDIEAHEIPFIGLVPKRILMLAFQRSTLQRRVVLLQITRCLLHLPGSDNGSTCQETEHLAHGKYPIKMGH